MRKKLGVIAVAAAALLAAPFALDASSASASTCQGGVPEVCSVYNGAARVLCTAAAKTKLGDCIQ